MKLTMDAALSVAGRAILKMTDSMPAPVLVGSRALGVNRENSDWDWIFQVSENFDLDDVVAALRECGKSGQIKRAEFYDNALYVTCSDGEMNMLFEPEESFNAWVGAIRRAERIPANLMQEKFDRITIFQALLAGMHARAFGERSGAEYLADKSAALYTRTKQHGGIF